MIDSWSYSKIIDFERCKFYAHLKHDLRIPEPQRELKPGQTEQANDRGSRIHDEAERFVRGIGPFTNGLRSFEAEFMHMQDLFASGLVSLEGEWGFDKNWEPMPWSGRWKLYELDDDEVASDLKFTKAKELPKRGVANGELILVGKELWVWEACWHRSKLDAMVRTSPTTAIVIDYKTGRLFGNEIKHGQQLQLYTVDALLLHPELEEVTTELWYLDQNEITSRTFTREHGLKFKNTFERRGTALTTAKSFPPAKNIYACQWCQYGPWNGGQCEDGVKKGWTPQ